MDAKCEWKSAMAMVPEPVEVAVEIALGPIEVAMEIGTETVTETEITDTMMIEEIALLIVEIAVETGSSNT